MIPVTDFQSECRVVLTFVTHALLKPNFLAQKMIGVDKYSTDTTNHS